MTLFRVSRFVSQCIGPPIQNGDYLQTSFMAILDHILLNSFIFHLIAPNKGLNQPGHPWAVILASGIFDFCSRLRRIPLNLKSSYSWGFWYINTYANKQGLRVVPGTVSRYPRLIITFVSGSRNPRREYLFPRCRISSYPERSRRIEAGAQKAARKIRKIIRYF